MRIGVDIVDIERIEKAITMRGKRFLSRIYTQDEIAYCEIKRSRWQSYAARFAAKEAVAKLLGTGFSRFPPNCIEIRNNEAGEPRITLYGDAHAIAKELGLSEIQISLSHTKDYAVAFAIADGGDNIESGIPG